MDELFYLLLRICLIEVQIAAVIGYLTERSVGSEVENIAFRFKNRGLVG